MATLNISTKDALGAAVATKVVVRLVDSSYNPVTGYTSGDVLVREVVERTDGDGALALDLTPNASISPSNTFYGVWIDAKRFLIEKTGDTQTLLEALAASPADLASVLRSNQLADVASTEADDDEVLVSTSGVWTPGQVPTGGLADDSVTNAKLTAGAVDTTELADDAVETAKIADANVTTSKIAAEAVTAPKVADAAVSIAKLDTTAGLRAFRAKATRSASTPLDVVVVGDSVTQGFTTTQGVSDWPAVLEELLAARVGATRVPGRGWLPPQAESGFVGTPTPYGWGNVSGDVTGNPTDGTADTTSGLGGWGRVLAVGDELEHTDTCDGITIYYTAKRTGGADIEVYVDDVLVHTIDTTDGTISAEQATLSGRSWTSNALSEGSHKVTLVAAGSGTAIVDGGYWHLGNRTSGIRVHRGGHSGWKAESDWTGTIEHVGVVKPAAVVIFLGLNDYATSTPADYAADLTTLAASFRFVSANSSILGLVPYANLNRADWDDWRAAGVAAFEAAGLPVIDLAAAMGNVAGGDVLDLSDDGLHLGTSGHRLLAEIVADALLPAPVDRVPALLTDGSRGAIGDLDLGGHKVTNVDDPTDDTDAATRGWVNTAAAALVATETAARIAGDAEERRRAASQVHGAELRGWNAALGNRSASVARVAVMGDGQVNTWARLVASRYHAIVGAGTASEWDIARRPNDDLQGWTTWTGAKDTDHGIGSRGGTLTGSQEGTITAPCDGFVLSYDVQQTGGADLQVYIDGALITTLTTTDAGVSGIESGRLWTSAALAPGSHTLRVTPTGAGTAKVGAALPTWGNRTTGVQVWKASHPDWTAADFEADPSTYEALDNLGADLVILGLGPWDYLEVTVAQFETNLTAVVESIADAVPLASIVLVANPGHLDRADWGDWVDAIKTVAEDNNAGFVDLTEVLGDLSDGSDPLALSPNGLAFSSAALQLAASAIASSTLLPGADAASAPLRANGSVPLRGDLSVYPGGGAVKLTSVLGLPVLSIYDDDSDAQAEITAVTSSLAAALFSFTGPFIGFGPGGSTAPNAHLVWTATGQLALLQNASTPGHLLTGQVTLAAELSSAPANPPAGAVLYTLDNAGTIELRARFADGTDKLIVDDS